LVIEVLLRRPGAADASQALGSALLFAPAHIDADTLSAVMRKVRRGELGIPAGRAALLAARRQPIERVPIAPLLDRAWSLRHNLSAYDALYVALARTIGCPLVTADRRLAAAPGLGVPITLIAG
jgi:predicted nucleic acid-binding protein